VGIHPGRFKMLQPAPSHSFCGLVLILPIRRAVRPAESPDLPGGSKITAALSADARAATWRRIDQSARPALDGFRGADPTTVMRCPSTKRAEPAVPTECHYRSRNPFPSSTVTSLAQTIKNARRVHGALPNRQLSTVGSSSRDALGLHCQRLSFLAVKIRPGHRETFRLTGSFYARIEFFFHIHSRG
jgi:hypothetical protein